MRIGMVLDRDFPPDPRVQNEINQLQDSALEGFLLIYQSELSEYKSFKVIQNGLVRSKVEPLKNIQNTIDLFKAKWLKPILKMIETEKLDLLHVHDLYMLPAALEAKKRTGIKVIADLHENYSSIIHHYTWATKFPNRFLVKAKKWLKKEFSLLSKCDGIITVTEIQLKQLIEKYPSLKTKASLTFPNIPNLSIFDQEVKHSKEKEDELHLFYFGAVGVRRGIETLVQAFEELKRENYRIKLTVIGGIDKQDRAVLEPILLNRQNEGLDFKGWMDISEAKEYFYKTDIGISPLFRNEHHDGTYANKVFQHIACAKPVIVSDCTAQKELIEKYQCGSVFEAENVSTLIKMIQMYYHSSNSYKDHSINCKSVIEDIRNVDYKKQFLELYLEVIGIKAN